MKTNEYADAYKAAHPEPPGQIPLVQCGCSHWADDHCPHCGHCKGGVDHNERLHTRIPCDCEAFEGA